jgi:flagella basal body P-ring formation protein FlgA
MLTAAGKALDDGGRGELIRVVNIQSNRTIDATVAAPGQVELALPGAPPPLL